MEFSRPVTEIITQRYSCRHYLEAPIGAEQRGQLEAFLASHTAGPLGTSARFGLVAATDESRQALRGLGTYGTIQNPTGFIIGAVKPGGNNLEGFGYLMERAVLFATDLGLGTVWLGGFFTRSSFSRAIGLSRGETIPAVIATGYGAAPNAEGDIMRRIARGGSRLPWEQLFSDGSFGAPLSRENAGPYAGPLEMVRLAPSASNKQPWRIVRDDKGWHFYVQRTAGYRNAMTKLVRVVDLQRVDLGIAMCHFELTALELGLAGSWQVREPGIERPGAQTEYTVTWGGERSGVVS
jgi:nitroreductase